MKKKMYEHTQIMINHADYKKHKKLQANIKGHAGFFAVQMHTLCTSCLEYSMYKTVWSYTMNGQHD